MKKEKGLKKKGNLSEMKRHTIGNTYGQYKEHRTKKKKEGQNTKRK